MFLSRVALIAAPKGNGAILRKVVSEAKAFVAVIVIIDKTKIALSIELRAIIFISKIDRVYYKIIPVRSVAAIVVNGVKVLRSIKLKIVIINSRENYALKDTHLVK